MWLPQWLSVASSFPVYHFSHASVVYSVTHHITKPLFIYLHISLSIPHVAWEHSVIWWWPWQHQADWLWFCPGSDLWHISSLHFLCWILWYDDNLVSIQFCNCLFTNPLPLMNISIWATCVHGHLCSSVCMCWDLYPSLSAQRLAFPLVIKFLFCCTL